MKRISKYDELGAEMRILRTQAKMGIIPTCKAAHFDPWRLSLFERGKCGIMLAPWRRLMEAMGYEVHFIRKSDGNDIVL